MPCQHVQPRTPDFSRKRAWLRTDRAVAHEGFPSVTSTKNAVRAITIVPHVGASPFAAVLADGEPPAAAVEMQARAATTSADVDLQERDI